MILNRFLNHPVRVLTLCGLFAASSILLNGVLNNLYSLNRNKRDISVQVEVLQDEIAKLNRQIKRAHEASFVERKALDSLDMASDEDLVFVFSE